MNAMAGDNFNNDNEGEGGPMWGRFFDSIGHEEDGSVMSGSHRHATDLHSFPSVNDMRSPHSEVHPNDSASVVDDRDDHASVMSGLPRNQKGGHSVTAPV